MFNPITERELRNWFTYHIPDSNQIVSYETIRNAALRFTMILIENTPPGADQAAAIRKVREAVMTANAAIACHSEK